MMKGIETHHAIDKMKVLHYFRFAAARLIFFPVFSISHIQSKISRNLAQILTT